MQLIYINSCGIQKIIYNRNLLPLNRKGFRMSKTYLSIPQY